MSDSTEEVWLKGSQSFLMESASSATFLLRRTILLNLLIVSPALTLGYVVNILEFSQSLSRGDAAEKSHTA